MRAHFQRNRGMTLMEMIVAAPVGLIVVLVVFTSIWVGMNLMAKNLSINLSHIQTRNAVDRLTGDIHESAFVPQLLDTLPSGTVFPLASGSSYPVLSATATGNTGAGIALEVYYAGPYSSAASTLQSVSLPLDGYTSAIKNGMQVYVPNLNPSPFAITGTTVNGTTITCATASGTNSSLNTGNGPFPIYILKPVLYYVSTDPTLSGTHLMRQENCATILSTGTSGVYSVASNGSTGATILIPDISPSTPEPFDFSNLTSPPRFVQICLGAYNPDYSGRKFGDVDMQFNFWVPYRGDLQAY